jgi:molecular chaperone GrpE
MKDDTNKPQDINDAPNSDSIEFTEEGMKDQEEISSDDIVYDDANSVQDTIKKLKEKLKIAEKEKQENLDGWQRVKADFANARKRYDDDKKDLIKFATEGLVEDLIPVLQNFEMAFANKEVWEKVDKNWRVGVEYIYQNFKQTLETRGLKEINPLGLAFDPSRDEGVEHIAVDSEDKDHTVVEVLQKGYELNGKMIRPPRVKVGEYKAE